MSEIEDLTASQMEAVEELRKRVEHEFSPQMREDETVFYRFLKARDFNLKAAEIMLRKHLCDRKTYGFDTILTEYQPPQLMKDYWPMSFVGYDKEGFIVKYLDLGKFDAKVMFNIFSFHEVEQFVARYSEEDWQRMREDTKQLGRPITKIIQIVNMDELNFVRATDKKVLDTVFKLLQLYQDSYPERIKSIYIINDGWKEELLKIIDADVLPAFLGGTRTDPDGNPLCQTFITHGKQIPVELYNRKIKYSLCKENNVKKLTVSRFSLSEIVFFVHEPSSLLEWEFETKSRDIGFALYYKDDSIDNAKTVELIPKQRIDTSFGSETGVYKCSKVGTYIIVFDNSYSWFYSKEIYYRITLKESDETETQSLTF